MTPTPKLRNPTVSGNPRRPIIRKENIGVGNYQSSHGDRGHAFRHGRQKPWFMPGWLWRERLKQLEMQEMLAMESGMFGMNSGMMSGGNDQMIGGDQAMPSGDMSDLDMPSDASNAWQNQLGGDTPPDLTKHRHKHHKHHKKARGGEDSMHGHTPSGHDPDATQAQPLSGGFNGQSPISNQNMGQASQPNTYTSPNKMDQGAMYSGDYATSKDVEQAGPTDMSDNSNDSSDVTYQYLSGGSSDE